jgi:hypothetical protein
MPVIKPYFPTAELEQRYKTAAEPTGNRRVRRLPSRRDGNCAWKVSSRS